MNKVDKKINRLLEKLYGTNIDNIIPYDEDDLDVSKVTYDDSYQTTLPVQEFFLIDEQNKDIDPSLKNKEEEIPNENPGEPIPPEQENTPETDIQNE